MKKHYNQGKIEIPLLTQNAKRNKQRRHLRIKLYKISKNLSHLEWVIKKENGKQAIYVEVSGYTWNRSIKGMAPASSAGTDIDKVDGVLQRDSIHERCFTL